jgi:DNA-nicking Smr family endonuclease
MMADDRKGRQTRRRLREDEHDLWLGVTRSVKPLRHARKAVVAADAEAVATGGPPSPPHPNDARSVVRPRPTAKPVPTLAPIDRRTKQRLARGTATIDARIDLHGMTQEAAHAALLRFLRNAQAAGARFALVITGKGARREDDGKRGVLKRQVPLWLTGPELRDYVVGFEAAHAGHGGEGALYVRVRRARKADVRRNAD